MRSRPPRILHVFRSPVGGLFRHVVDLAREQAASGCEVGIFCDDSSGNERTREIMDGIAPNLALGIVRTPMRRAPNLGDVLALRRLALHQAGIGADVMHGHGAKGGAYVRLLPEGARKGAVRAYTPHGGSFHFGCGRRRWSPYPAIERWLARRTEVLLFESQFVADRFAHAAGPPPCPSYVVHNGLHPHEFEPLAYARDRHDLLFIGEMVRAKGIDTLIEALAAMKAGGRRVTLLAVGSGADGAAMAEMARRLGVADQIAFEPAQPIRPALARSRLMVMPSRAESLPYVILEAGAAGHPIVATAVGGIPEIMGPTGCTLVEPADPGILAQEIAVRLDEGETARSARTGALRNHLRDRFSVTRMTDTVLAGYEAGAAAAGEMREMMPAATQAMVKEASRA